MKKILVFVSVFLFVASVLANDFSQPIVTEDVVFEETNGSVAIEAEFFYKQSITEIRQWYRHSKNEIPEVGQDEDKPHLGGASNGAYIEVLPDTRVTHDDKLIAGENFSNEPGKMAVAHYKVYFNHPGKYYVWVRAFSMGGEDNGLHVGMNGEWPESGQRLQWCEGKNTWHWESKQRTQEVHCGEPYGIYLDIREAGLQDIQFSLREDGFEFDKFILTTEKDPGFGESVGPAVKLKSGTVPPPYPAVVEMKEPKLPFSDPSIRLPDGDGSVSITGELKQWHKVTLTLDGPFAHELDKNPNAFTDYNMMVNFTHESGVPSYEVPGYFAADGNASESSADAGTKWRAHLSPDKAGKWTYTVSLRKGKNTAQEFSGDELDKYSGISGEIIIGLTDKTGRDFRSGGRLEYVGKHYLQYQGNKKYFLKAGADAPETLLAYEDFDATYTMKSKGPLKSYEKHLGDWKEGYPTWKEGKGKGLVGAVAYLSGKGANSFSFLTYNAGGDGDNVWPFIKRNEKFHYDCSKLDQWGIVFDFAQAKGMYLHFKLQENELDDNIEGRDKPGIVEESLDGGDLGPERKLYCREMVARFGYLLALNWNIGEENTQSIQQKQDMITFLSNIQPYRHNIVIHTFPSQQDEVYNALLGENSLLTGVSLQNGWDEVFEKTLHWRNASAEAGRPWVVANDEQGSASLGVPPDPGYNGFDPASIDYDVHDIRKQSLYGNLMAGGAGVEYYFGYKLPENDLICEDFRSRDKSWNFCKIALDFFNENLPFHEMENADALIGNTNGDKGKHCLAKEGEIYLVYLAYENTTSLDLAGTKGTYKVKWFNPRTGGEFQTTSIKKVKGEKVVDLGQPPTEIGEDWLVIISK